MSNKLYTEKIEELVKHTSFLKSFVFEYDFSPYKDEFEDVFLFYQENLERNYKYGIDPSIIFFNNKETINAKAGKENGYFIISMNMGTIVRLINLFRHNSEILNENDHPELIKFETLLDTPIHVLMYQNAIHFTFYHEMAHLIQKSNFLQNSLYEHLDNTEQFSERKHLLELDADEFSSISIGAQILQYAETTFGENITETHLKKLLLIACSSAFLYLLTFRSNRMKIYYEEMSHPHPIIRMTWIIFTIAGYCIRSLQAKGIEINITTKEIINDTLDFSEGVAEHFFTGANPITLFRDSMQNEALNIFAYITKYQKLKENDTTLAVYKWNQLAN